MRRQGAWALALCLAALAGLGCVAVEPPRGEGQEKVTLCHKGRKTLTVAAPAADAHRRHGDTLGPCN